MYTLFMLDKDTIKNEMLPHISTAKRGDYPCKLTLTERKFHSHKLYI